MFCSAVQDLIQSLVEALKATAVAQNSFASLVDCMSAYFSSASEI